MLKLLKSTAITLCGIALGFVIMIIAVTLAISSLTMTSFTETVSRQECSLLEINMDEMVVNTPAPPTLDQLLGLNVAQRQVTLLNTIRAIELAASDPNIVAISLRMDGSASMSLTSAHEMRQVLGRFRASCDKPIYAYAEDYSQLEYYIASAADSIFVHPLGGVEWRGMAMGGLYYGGLFERLGIEVEVFRPEACIYKSAVEPFTRTQMSPESRAQSQRIVDELWASVVDEVAQSRNISARQLEQIACDEVVVDASQAIERRMIDGKIYLRDYNRLLEERGVVLKNNTPRTITLAQYSGFITSLSTTADDHVAMIYVDGVIGVESDDYSGVNARRLARMLRRVAADDKVKGVILRVDSPGGGAIAADVVAREVVNLRREKLVVVSMGSVAASGGYYVSTPADAIFADRFTITGSIGVYGMALSVEQLLDRQLHIASDVVGTSPSADFGSPLRHTTTTEQRAIMRSVDEIYDQFTQLVSSTRHLAPERVDTLSQGRVWTAQDALDGGLIDGVGGINHALAYAMEQLAMGVLPIEEVVDEPSGWGLILSAFGAQANQSIFGSVSMARELVGGELPQIVNASEGGVAYFPLRIKF
ncbi:MAG: signal peptide peptidase SppA [Rikenellaceae bacterium]